MIEGYTDSRDYIEFTRRDSDRLTRIEDKLDMLIESTRNCQSSCSASKSKVSQRLKKLEEDSLRHDGATKRTAVIASAVTFIVGTIYYLILIGTKI